jgi:hypothetical protein
MSSPDTSKNPETTKMTNPPASQVKMVKVKALHPIRVMKGGHEHIVTPGQVAEVTPEEAHEFCDKKFQLGHRDAFGNIDPMMDASVKKEITRAVRV